MDTVGSGSPVVGIVVFVVYFIPAIVAIVGRHRRWLLITLIDLLFGWTVIGWIIALALLATGRRQQPPPPPPPPPAAGQGGLPAPIPPSPPPAAGPAESRVEQLERLAALRDSGALTDDEFAAEKAKLLDTP